MPEGVLIPAPVNATAYPTLQESWLRDQFVFIGWRHRSSPKSSNVKQVAKDNGDQDQDAEIILCTAIGASVSGKRQFLPGLVIVAAVAEGSLAIFQVSMPILPCHLLMSGGFRSQQIPK